MNRRTFEMVVLIVILLEPAKAIPRMWFKKHLVTAPPGSLRANAAEVANLTLGR
jgi:hypothetical protein